MRVRFKPLFGQDSVSVPDVLDENGNPVYFALGELAERDLSSDDAAIVLSNPNFVEAGSGKSPHFDEHGRDLPEKASTLTPVPATIAGVPVPAAAAAAHAPVAPEA